MNGSPTHKHRKGIAMTLPSGGDIFTEQLRDISLDSDRSRPEAPRRALAGVL